MDGSNENNVRNSMKNVSIKYDNAFYLTIPPTLECCVLIYIFLYAVMLSCQIILLFLSLLHYLSFFPALYAFVTYINTRVAYKKSSVQRHAIAIRQCRKRLAALISVQCGYVEQWNIVLNMTTLHCND